MTVTLGAALSVVCVLALLMFLHFVARSFVADEVIRRAAGELEANLATLPPLDGASAAPSAGEGLPADFDARAAVLRSREEGYVETVDYAHLVRIAAERELVLRLDFRAGTFVSEGGWLGEVYPGDAIIPEVAHALQEPILLGPERTPTQDIEYSIRHLVDIALRALSPGINDANTALVVVDRLSGAMARLMGKALPSAEHRDASGRVRVIAKPNNYDGVLDAALHQIRQAAASHPAVIINLLGALGRIAEHVRLPEQRDALLRHARLIADAGLRDCAEASDRADIDEAFAAACERIAKRHAAQPEDRCELPAHG